MIRLETNIHGVFALRDAKVIESLKFPRDAQEIADKLESIKDGVSEEEKKVLDKLLETGNDRFLVQRPRRFQGLDLDAVFQKDTRAVDVLELGEQIGVPRDKTRQLLREVNKILSQNRLKEIDRDQLVIQAVTSLDELQESANLLNERLREWYSLYFPELDHLVSGNEVYTRLVAQYGRREDYEGNMGLDQSHAGRIKKAADETLGMDFTEKDLDAVLDLAERNHRLFQSIEDTQDYVDDLMKELAPNLRELVGSELGARLIAQAGSLNRLATLPAGTIQVLGAEDAFFRFMKTGKKPPKHGVIFQYPDIRGAKRKNRGKLARTLAAKIAIAARADAYTGNMIAPKLKKEFNKRVKQVK